MNNGSDDLIRYHLEKRNMPLEIYTKADALKEFDELKNIALNCFDKNGNPNISVAMRAIENKAKIAGLYSKIDNNAKVYVNMNEITIDSEQLKLNIGDEYL